MGILSRWRRRRSLEGVGGPARVDLRAEVLTPNDVVSPLSGVRSALIQWVLVAVTTVGGGRDGGRSAIHRPFASGFFGEVLTLGTPHGTIEVPVEGLRFEGVTDPDDASAIEHPLPAGLVELANRDDLTGGHEVRYRESLLRRHDLVRLRAVVEPLASEGGAYRGGGRADFLVRSDLGNVTLVDLTRA